MSARASTVLVSLVLNAGVSAEELARASGMPVAHLTTGTLLPYEDGMRLWHAAERLTGDPRVGLHAGAAFGVDQLSALGTVFAHAPSLNDALAGLARLLPIVIHGAPVEFDAAAGELRYVSPGLEPHGVDCMFAAIVRAARDCTRRKVALRGVELQAARPADPREHETFFGTRPVWGRPVSVMRFDRADLDAPMRGAEPAIATLLEDRAARLLDVPSGAVTLERETEVALRTGVLRGETSLETIARAMGRSPRTLQRQLADEGTSFAAVRDRALRERAEALLEDPERSVESIALELGFATRAAFARAFRRWTGRAPRGKRSWSGSPS